MRIWQTQLRTSDLLHAAGFRWRNGRWEKKTSVELVTCDYVKQIHDALCCVNAGPFHGIEPGRIMLTGAKARKRTNDWEITFDVQPAKAWEMLKGTDFRIIEPIQAKGQDE